MAECDCLEDLRFCDQYISYFSVLFYPRICVKMSEDEREIDVESEDEEYASVESSGEEYIDELEVVFEDVGVSEDEAEPINV